MVAVHCLGFLKFNFLTVGMVKTPILHHRAKFFDDDETVAEIAPFLRFSRCRLLPSGTFKSSKF